MPEDLNTNAAPQNAAENKTAQPAEPVEQPAAEIQQAEAAQPEQTAEAAQTEVAQQPEQMIAETPQVEAQAAAEQAAAETPQAEITATEQAAIGTPQAEIAAEQPVAQTAQFQDPSTWAPQAEQPVTDAQQPQQQEATSTWAGPQETQPAFVPQTPAPQQQQQVGDTAPLVLGILSIVFAGIIGLVLSIIGMSKSKQVLAVMPESGKAKGGRICSIIGLILSIIAIVATILLFTVFGVGIGILGGEAAGAEAKANETLTALTKPSASDQEEIAEYFAQAFYSESGISLEDLGIKNSDISKWLFENASYKITDTSINSEDGKTSATVKADVTARSFEDLSTTLATKLNDPTVTSKLNAATTTAEIYAILGQVIKDSMAATPESTKTVDVKLTKENGKWVVSDSVIEKLAYQIYAS